MISETSWKMTDNAVAVESKRMSPFTGDRGVSFDLSRPFWRDDYAWSTDGRILLRQRETSSQPHGDPAHTPRTTCIPLSDDCHEAWPSSKDLRNVDADGLPFKRESVVIAGRKIAIGYARKVARLAGPCTYSPEGESNEALLFATRDYLGAVMPICKV